MLAEYIVACALGLADEKGVRNEWDAYDLKYSGHKIEVKSAAYIQSWYQKKLSPITFVIPKTRSWDANTGKMDRYKKRQADIYIFALLFHTDKETIDPLNLNQWQFFVISTDILNVRSRSQHSITLKSLEKLSSGAVSYSDLSKVVEKYVDKKQGKRGQV